MKRKIPWPEDPVVQEVRRIRQQLWREAGGTFEGLLRLLDERVPKRPKRPAKRRKLAKSAVR